MSTLKSQVDTENSITLMGSFVKDSTADGLRLSEKIYSYIIDSISKGVFAPGSRISERKLAQQLGVSHIPVREAMERLIHDQWVKRIPNMGIVVKKINTSAVRRELYQVRGALERCAVQLIIDDLTDEKISALEKAADNFGGFETGEFKNFPLNTTLEENDSHKNYDIQFHNLILQLSGNQRLWQVGRILVLQTVCYFNVPPNSTLMQLYLRSENPCPQVRHHTIVDAIRKKDIKAAEDVIRAHLDYAYHSSRYLRQTLKLE